MTTETPSQNEPSIEESPSPKSSLPFFPVLLTTLIFISIGLIYYYYQTLHPDFSLIATLKSLFPQAATTSMIITRPTPTVSRATPKPTAIPTPIPLTSGLGDYNVSHAKSAGPSISRVIFDPLDVSKGENLHLKVFLKSPSIVETVTGFLNMDHQTIPLVFTFSEEAAGQNQIWESTTLLPDTVLYKYILSITGVDKNGITTVIVAPRS